MNNGYQRALRGLSLAAERIIEEMRCPAYTIDPEPTRPAAGYDPYRLTNEQLQLAIDNAMEVVRKGLGPGVHAGSPETISALLEDHLNDLLEIQRERAAGAP